MLDFEFVVKRKLEVLELEQIEKEYMLVHARLHLMQKDPDPSHIMGPTSSAEETVSMLVNVGLLDCAVNICRLFKMPLTPVFEGLASRYVLPYFDHFIVCNSVALVQSTTFFICMLKL